VDNNPHMYTTIHAAAAAIRRKEITPVDLVHACFAAIDQREHEIQAWVFVDRDVARHMAEKATRELAAGLDRGPLHGIPIGIKDIYDVADWPTAAGSVRWKNAIARDDASTIARLRQAGAVFLGKTVTTAFASFDPPPTRNPWDLSRTPGGSSSGSAAALATGMCLGAVGSQTGGSITRPASYCGVAGCKPTYGLLPLDGIVRLAPSMDHPGPMATCVADLRILLQALAGPHLRPASTVGQAASLPVKIARVSSIFTRRAEPAVLESFNQTIARLQSHGVEIIDLALPALFEDVIERHMIVMSVEAAGWHRERFARHPDDYPPRIRSLIETGLSTSAADYTAAKQHQMKLSDEMDALLETGDAAFLLTPATTDPAPPADTTGSPAFNAPWSYTGLPTVSIPTGLKIEGLPLAIQLVGPRHMDADLLNVAEFCERALLTGDGFANV
jgi:Asp-tRNA(Asn)/Glu-tRNA(Gln) amidotransferase A subunit family amidase